MKNLKTLFFSLFSLLMTSFLFGQSVENWKEKKDFHAVMSKTFHPAEEGNFEPVKMRSAELALKANAWRKSDIPADVQDKKAVKKSLNKLCKDSKKLNRSVKNGATNDELKIQLFALHDTFHTIVGLCNLQDEHENHDK